MGAVNCVVRRQGQYIGENTDGKGFLASLREKIDPAGKSMVMFGSTLKDGNRHDNENLPLILAGRAKGKLRPGRRVRAPEKTPLCNLYLTMLDHMGIHEKKFGDSTGLLEGLS